MVNKLPPELDHPLDNIIYNHIDKQLPWYKKHGFSPNGLTTLSLAAGLFAVHLVLTGHYEIGAFFWFVAYYYDCADGKLARRYQMTSAFGDLYDHGADAVKHIFMIGVLCTKLKKFKGLAILVGLLITILLASQMGCQETYALSLADAPPKHSLCLKMYQSLVVFDDCKTQMKYTRYFGPVTGTIYIMFLILGLRRMT